MTIEMTDVIHLPSCVGGRTRDSRPKKGVAILDQFVIHTYNCLSAPVVVSDDFQILFGYTLQHLTVVPGTLFEIV